MIFKSTIGVGMPVLMRRVNCAWVEHADTGARIATLLPTGQTTGTPPPSALVLQKVPDAARQVEHFLYTGTLLPGVTLPCGVPLRLVLDNAYQSPRFLAYPDLSAFLKLEWWHAGPLSGVPYGTGLRQRLYIAGAALAYGKTREEREVSKRAATGGERVDFLALYRTASLSTEPLPAYLSEALDGTPAHQYAEVDGEAWTVKASKDKSQGDQGGRASMELSLEQEEVVIRRAGPQPALPAVPYDPATDAPRPWRCGDASDTAPDWIAYGFTCALDANDRNTGYVNELQRDLNPHSGSYNTTRNRVSTAPDPTRCPLPVRYYTRRPSVTTATRNNCPSGQSGSTETFMVPAGDVRFFSYANAAAAETLADQYVADNAQAYANANGTCYTAGAGGTVQWAPAYTPDGCFACTMYNVNDPGQVRDATVLEAKRYAVAGYSDSNNNYVACPDCI